MPYASVYRNMSEEQKEKERERSRQWHKNNYEKIKERKQLTARKRWDKVGKKEYTEGVFQIEYKLGRLVQAAKSRAKKNNIPFNISLPYVLSLYLTQNKVCALSNREFDIGKRERRVPHNNAPSIDRIVPALGYVEGNIRLVTHHINMAISSYGLEELLSLVEDVRKNYA